MNKYKHKLALAMIVKGDDNEAELLDRCLSSLGNYVDAIYVTSTHKKGEEANKSVDKVCTKHKANISYFEWCNDFAKARNYNFSQVPKEYDYILWVDSDDIMDGLDKLRDTIDGHLTTDAFAFWYLYDFDEYRQPTIVHKKTQIVRNDGCVEWAGALHEDFKENRSIQMMFVEGIRRIHLTTEKRIEIARKRNVEVSLGDAELNSEDPRVYWNLANSYLGDNRNEEGRETFIKFISLTNSEEEKYLARCRLGTVEHQLSHRDAAIENLEKAIGMKPHYPDAYFQLGYIYAEYHNWDKAEYYLLMGLKMKPPYHTMIVYNPRDYDYNPMMLLSKVYFQKNRPDLALPFLKGCLQIYPENIYIKQMIDEMQKESDRLLEVVTVIKELSEETDEAKVIARIDSLSEDLRSHPGLCAIRNKIMVKKESTGKDIAYYCGMTTHEWNPKLFREKGFGGSEESVINLSQEFAKQGYNVTVYSNCGHQKIVDNGVTYRPYWEFNPRDKWDKVILWRSPKAVDAEMNTPEIYIDLHDVIPQGEFTPKRLDKITKVFVKSNAHRVLFPNIPDEKIAIVSNGYDAGLFDQKIEKNQYLMVNTSSSDRSMDILVKLFRRVKEQVPQARLKWAYGWNTFNDAHALNKDMIAWRDNLIKEMEEAGVESLGKLSQKECAKLYLEGNIFAYPTGFYEIDCISARKAQAAGCYPVTTDFAALDETVQFGTKIHTSLNKDNWAKSFQFSFGIKDEKEQDAWVEACVKKLKEPIEDRTNMMNYVKEFTWDKIALKWINVIQ